MKPKGPNGPVPDAVVLTIRRNAATRKAVTRIRKALKAILRDTPRICDDAKRYGLSLCAAKLIANGLSYKRVKMPGPSSKLRTAGYG